MRGSVLFGLFEDLKKIRYRNRHEFFESAPPDSTFCTSVTPLTLMDDAEEAYEAG